MSIIEARRITAFVDRFHMSMERLAKQLDCSEHEARMTYLKAKNTCDLADARNAVAELNRLTESLNMSTAEMLKAFA